MVLAKKGNSEKNAQFIQKQGRHEIAQCVGDLQASEYWGGAEQLSVGSHHPHDVKHGGAAR